MSKIHELLKLEKPLVIFDLETTGLSLNIDRIVEMAYIKIYPDGKIKKADIFLNPEMHISDESSVVHGIKDEDVAGKQTFREVAQELWEVFSDCCYSGFNITGFDLPILRREFLRAGLDFDYTNAKIVDSKVIYNYMEPRTLSAAFKYYCGKELHDAHSALADVQATAEVLEKQIEKYNEVQNWEFIDKIHRASEDRFVDNDRKFYWRNGEAYFAFSKHKDESLKSVAQTDPGFLSWILQADFSDEMKNIVRNALNGKFPSKADNS